MLGALIHRSATVVLVKRLGLLQCDNLDDPHRTIAGDYDTLYAELLADDAVEVVLFAAHRGELPANPGECDAWLIPGSRHSVYDDLPWIVELRAFVRSCLDASSPLVGICFGHQMIAQEMGAPVGKAAEGWNVGAKAYKLHADPPGEHLGNDLAARQFTLAASHQDQVLALPDGAQLLAQHPTCPVAGFVVDHRVLSVQGHPEFSAPLAASLYDSRRDRIGDAVVDDALASLEADLDRTRVARWILDFVKAARPS